MTDKDNKWLSHSGIVNAQCYLIVRVEKWDCKAISGVEGNSSLSSDGSDWETSAAGSPGF